MFFTFEKKGAIVHNSPYQLIPKTDTKTHKEDTVKIDFSGVEDFKPVPNGTYDCILESYTFDVAKSSGQPKVNLVFESTEEDYRNRKFWKDFSLQPQALFAIKQAAIALGADPADFEGTVDLEDVLTNLRGNPCRIVVTTEEYEGKERNKVKSVLEAGAGALFR